MKILPNTQRLGKLTFDSNQVRKSKTNPNVLVAKASDGKDYGVVRKDDGSYDFAGSSRNSSFGDRMATASANPNIGSRLLETAGLLASEPQRIMTRKLSNNKYNSPSEFIQDSKLPQGLKNTVGLASDMIADPSNLVGIGVGAKAAKLAMMLPAIPGLNKLFKSSKVMSKIDDAIQPFKSKINWSKWNKEIPNNKKISEEYNNIEQSLNSEITKFKNLENNYNIRQKELWGDYKSGKITGEEYTKQIKSTQPWDPFESPIYPLQKQLRELSVKKDILNTPQKNILKNEQELGKNISDGGTNNKGVFELNDNYVARLSAHGYDDASRLVNYADKLTSPRIMKTHQVKELNGKIYQVQDKATGIPYTKLSEQQLKNLPKNHIDNFYKDIAELEKNGLNIDISGGKSNIFYDLKKGFQFIDLGIGKMPNIDVIKNVVKFKNGGTIGNNGMFDMTNPNIYKGIVPGAIAAGAAASTMSNKDKNNKFKYGGKLLPLLK